MPTVPGVKWDDTNKVIVFDDTDMECLLFFIKILEKREVYIKNEGSYAKLKTTMIKGIIIKSVPSGVRVETILSIDNKPVIIALYGLPGIKIIGLDIIPSKHYKFDWCFMIDEDGYTTDLEEYIRYKDDMYDEY